MHARPLGMAGPSTAGAGPTGHGRRPTRLSDREGSMHMGDVTFWNRNWDDALVFRVVAEELSFTRAATRLGVRQPVLSRRVARLERHLGRTLLARTTRQIRITPAGAVLLRGVRDVCAQWREVAAVLPDPEAPVLASRDAFTVHTVARETSFARAAAALHSTRATVSQRVRRIEEDLGVPLFHRHPRRLEPTAAGRALTGALARIIAEWERTVATLRVGDAGERAELPPRVRLCSYSLAVGLLLDHLGRRWPLVSWSTVGYDAVDVPDPADVDLVLGFEIPRHRARRPPWAQCIPLLWEPSWLALANDHPLARSPGLALADLADEDWILQPDGPLRDMVDDACRAAGFRPRPTHVTRDVSAIRALVSSGRGVTLAAPTAPTRGEFALRPLARAPSRLLFLAWNPRSFGTPAARDCAGAVVDWYRDRTRRDSPDYWRHIVEHPDVFPPLTVRRSLSVCGPSVQVGTDI